jgi:hypothetical protein
MMWCRFVLHQDLPTVLRCHIAAFEALGGVRITSKPVIRRVGRPHRLETAHRPNQLLELAMVGLDDVVQILDLSVLRVVRALAFGLQLGESGGVVGALSVLMTAGCSQFQPPALARNRFAAILFRLARDRNRSCRPACRWLGRGTITCRGPSRRSRRPASSLSTVGTSARHHETSWPRCVNWLFSPVLSVPPLWERFFSAASGNPH